MLLKEQLYSSNTWRAVYYCRALSEAPGDTAEHAPKSLLPGEPPL